MSLSNTVKTHIIDARSHNNQRTEFRLDNAFYTSDWKLIDLGIYDPNIPDASGGYYPMVNGVAQSIKNIYLYSGTTQIDSLRYCAEYSSLEALKTTNQGSMDFNRDTLLNGMGFQIVRDDGALGLDGANSFFNTRNTVNSPNFQIPITKQSYNGQSGSLNLSMLLKFLKSTRLLPMIPDLRLVVEWDVTASDYYTINRSYTLNPQVIQPTLVVEEQLGLNPADAKAYNIPYLSTIAEVFTVPATGTPANDTVPLRSSFKSQAFTDKFLKDLTFYNSTTDSLADPAGYLTNKNRSPAQKGEQLQLIVNSMTHLPDRGIDNPSLKYHFFNDAQSQLNLPYVAGLHEVRDASGRILEGDSRAVSGQFSVTSVKVGKVVKEMRIEYERLYGNANWSRNAFNLLAFGTVAKNLEVKDGRARVSY